MTTSFESLLSADHGPVRVLTLNRPQALNALDVTLVRELTEAVRIAGADAAEGRLRALILTGAGKAFVAGADIAAMHEMSEDEAREFSRQGHTLGERLAALPIPVIAAVNGFALGGGCELALACDFIYASEAAKFGQPEVKLGVIPGFGGTQRLLRRVGLARALELCMSGEIINAAEALRIGLANKVLPADQLLPAAIKTCETIAQMGPQAVAVAKSVLHRGSELPLAAANSLEIDAFARLFSTADQREGMAAFLGKRPAAFTGRPDHGQP
ncbi:MAG: enoyl-CoA hydratase/isomerase family protein [Nannocystis sp.]|nr:enoyl-CoA hydratase-related protein [Nannocystis sp.]MBA3545491.1 enoyl-CoA hydratase/isomerase family protein [Nannocystis sp.]